MGKFCKNCGKPMKENEKFCAKCGTKSDVVRTASPGAVKKTPLSMTGGGINRNTFSIPGGMGIRRVMGFGERVGDNETRYKIVLVIISVLMIISTLVPYVEMMGQTVSLLFVEDEIGDGVLYIGVAVVCIAGVCVRKRIVTVIAGATASIMCCYELYKMNEAYREFSVFSGMVIKRAGFYLVVITSFSMLAVSILYYLQTRKI